MKYAKDKIYPKIKNIIFKGCKIQERHPKDNPEELVCSINSQKGINTSDRTDCGMKYVQILFYYVQDASLFMVLLPQTEQQNDNILQQILLFSPPLSALYTKASTFCLSEETTAVTKIFIIYLFGPFVILLLFMLFLFHKLILFVKGYSNTQGMFSLAISQAILLAILLSFQQIIKGSLSLVQCVAVYEDKCLLVQGNIECYTWWQIMVKLFIYLHIGPLILVFSILPFCVQERKMARKVFILACFLPTPVIIYMFVPEDY